MGKRRTPLKATQRKAASSRSYEPPRYHDVLLGEGLSSHLEGTAIPIPDQAPGYRWSKGPTYRAREIRRGADVLDMMKHFQSNVKKSAERHGIDPALINAIIYEEQTHLTPFEAMLESLPLIERTGFGKSVGLGQIKPGLWSKDINISKEELLDPQKNIEAIARVLLKVKDRKLKHYGDENPPADVWATKYNFPEAKRISTYGQRVKIYYDFFKNFRPFE